MCIHNQEALIQPAETITLVRFSPNILDYSNWTKYTTQTPP
uniref:Uncharacterized protein n=1 Tax=Anguilla anguilla TaxID=7936 RepID=A0A0E9SMC6_ANGAN